MFNAFNAVGRDAQKEYSAMTALWQYTGASWSGPIPMTTAKRDVKAGLFIPNWAFSSIISILLFAGGMATAYFTFRSSVEVRLTRVEEQNTMIRSELNDLKAKTEATSLRRNSELDEIKAILQRIERSGK